MVQRQPQQALVVAPALLAALFAAAVAGCGRGGDAAKERNHAPSEAADSKEQRILAGEEPPIAVFLAPLRAEGEAAAWYEQRLRDLVPEPEGLSFRSLFVFHLGSEGAPPVHLEGMGVRLRTAQGSHPNVPLLPAPGAPLPDELEASVLPYKALETFAGIRLEAGASFEALVAFDLDSEGGFAAVVGGELDLGNRHIPLRASTLSRGEIDGLNEGPTRERILASLQGEPAQPSGR